MSTAIDHQRERFIALWDSIPEGLRRVLLAGLEIVESLCSGQEPRPGANEENQRIVTEAIDQARNEGKERLAQLLEGLIDPENLLGEESGEVPLDQHLARA